MPATTSATHPTATRSATVAAARLASAHSGSPLHISRVGPNNTTPTAPTAIAVRAAHRRTRSSATVSSNAAPANTTSRTFITCRLLEGKSRISSTRVRARRQQRTYAPQQATTVATSSRCGGLLHGSATSATEFRTPTTLREALQGRTPLTSGSWGQAGGMIRWWMRQSCEGGSSFLAPVRSPRFPVASSRAIGRRRPC
jgi:hypothetical protein